MMSMVSFRSLVALQDPSVNEAHAEAVEEQSDAGEPQEFLNPLFFEEGQRSDEEAAGSGYEGEGNVAWGQHDIPQRQLQLQQRAQLLVDVASLGSPTSPSSSPRPASAQLSPRTVLGSPAESQGEHWVGLVSPAPSAPTPTSPPPGQEEGPAWSSREGQASPLPSPSAAAAGAGAAPSPAAQREGAGLIAEAAGCNIRVGSPRMQEQQVQQQPPTTQQVQQHEAHGEQGQSHPEPLQAPGPHPLPTQAGQSQAPADSTGSTERPTQGQASSFKQGGWGWHLLPWAHPRKCAADSVGEGSGLGRQAGPCWGDGLPDSVIFLVTQSLVEITQHDVLAARRARIAMCGVCSAWRRVALPALFPRLGAPGSTWPQTGFTPGSTAAAHPFLSASGALRMALAGGTISGRPGPAAAAATASPSAAAAAGGGAAGGPGRVPGAVVVHPEQMLCRSGGWAPAPERGANGRGSNGIGSNGAAQGEGLLKCSVVRYKSRMGLNTFAMYANASLDERLQGRACPPRCFMLAAVQTRKAVPAFTLSLARTGGHEAIERSAVAVMQASGPTRAHWSLHALPLRKRTAAAKGTAQPKAQQALPGVSGSASSLWHFDTGRASSTEQQQHQQEPESPSKRHCAGHAQPQAASGRQSSEAAELSFRGAARRQGSSPNPSRRAGHSPGRSSRGSSPARSHRLHHPGSHSSSPNSSDHGPRRKSYLAQHPIHRLASSSSPLGGSSGGGARTSLHLSAPTGPASAAATGGAAVGAAGAAGTSGAGPGSGGAAGSPLQPSPPPGSSLGAQGSLGPRGSSGRLALRRGSSASAANASAAVAAAAAACSSAPPVAAEAGAARASAAGTCADVGGAGAYVGPRASPCSEISADRQEAQSATPALDSPDGAGSSSSTSTAAAATGPTVAAAGNSSNLEGGGADRAGEGGKGGSRGQAGAGVGRGEGEGGHGAWWAAPWKRWLPGLLRMGRAVQRMRKPAGGSQGKHWGRAAGDGGKGHQGASPAVALAATPATWACGSCAGNESPAPSTPRYSAAHQEASPGLTLGSSPGTSASSSATPGEGSGSGSPGPSASRQGSSKRKQPHAGPALQPWQQGPGAAVAVAVATTVQPAQQLSQPAALPPVKARRLRLKQVARRISASTRRGSSPGKGAGGTGGMSAAARSAQLLLAELRFRRQGARGAGLRSLEYRVVCGDAPLHLASQEELGQGWAPGAQGAPAWSAALTLPKGPGSGTAAGAGVGAGAGSAAGTPAGTPRAGAGGAGAAEGGSCAQLAGKPGLQPQQEQALRLVNRAPQWNPHLQCWCLSFGQRVKLPSCRNFQLCEAPPRPGLAPRLGSGGGVHPSPPTAPQGAAPPRIVLQFGKVDTRGTWALDFDPRVLSPVAALAAAVSTFPRAWLLRQ